MSSIGIIDLTCLHCSKSFQRSARSHKDGKKCFCSFACHQEYRRANVAGKEVPCAICHSPVLRFPYQLKQRKNIFCSPECHNTFLRGKPSPRSTFVEVTCANCGTPFKRPKRVAKARYNYCSHSCHNTHQGSLKKGPNHHNYQKISMPCQACGLVVTVSPSRTKRAKKFFCCKACYSRWQRDIVGPKHLQWKGGKTEYYGPNWYEQRRQARKRDNYRCQYCGVNEKKLARELDVHHIMPFREFGIENYLVANQLSNLICFCATCHTLAEHSSIPVQPKLL